MRTREKRIAIIGGGASGMLVAIPILRDPGQVSELLVFEESPVLGAGLAYRNDDPELLLNVPYDRMHARSEDPAGFTRFLERHHPEALSDRHVPYVQRRYFREYLQGEIAEAKRLAPASLSYRHVSKRVQSLKPNGSGWLIETQDGTAFSVDAIILAMGYSGRPAISQLLRSSTDFGRRILDCEDPEAIRTVAPEERVLIIGAGLSAIDAWRVLRSAESATNGIHFISRHGLFPVSHEKTRTEFKMPRSVIGLSPIQLFSLSRAFNRSGISWPAIADALRAYAPLIWRSWTLAERRAFVRHLKIHWDCIRHRIPHTVYDDLANELRAGKSILHGGRIRSATLTASGIEVEWQDRHTGETRRSVYDRIVNAVGAPIQTRVGETDWEALGVGESALGLEVANSPSLFTIGPLSRVARWETVAVPEIRQEAEACAARLRSEASCHLPLSKFRLHPRDAGESYARHFLQSFSFALKLTGMAGKAVIHALVPCLHRETVSDQIRCLAKRISTRRVRTKTSG